MGAIKGSDHETRDQSQTTDLIPSEIKDSTEEAKYEFKDEENNICVNTLDLDDKSSYDPLKIDVDIEVRLVPLSKRQAYTNLLILSLGFNLNFTAFLSFQVLQSSINTEGGLGTTGLAVLYAVMVLTSLFLAPVALSRVSYKWIMVTSTCSYSVFMASGFYSTWGTVISTSILIGFGAAHLWPSQQAYTAELARLYGKGDATKTDQHIKHFTGIFFGIFFTSIVWGNVISSVIFQSEGGNSTSAVKNTCGASYCPYEVNSTSLLQTPAPNRINMFIGFCVGTSLLGALCLCLLPNIQTPLLRRHNACNDVSKVCRLAVTSRDQNLLIIPSVTTGALMAFFYGDFTAAFVSCPYSVHNVGLVTVTYGVTMTLGTVAIGRLSKTMGHLVFFTLSFLLLIALSVVLLLWQPSDDKMYMTFVFAGVFGLAFSSGEPLLSVLNSIYFREDLAPALSSFRACSAIGWAVPLAYSNWLCTNYKLYIVICLVTLTYGCLVTLAVRHRETEPLCRKRCENRSAR